MVQPAHDPMVTTWTLEVQRELPGNLALTVGYVGSHGTHLAGNMWHSWDYVSTANKLLYKNSVNQAVPITDYYSGNAASALAQVWGTDELPRSSLLVPYPMWDHWGQVQQFNGENVYHALQIRLQKRFSHGLNFDLAYINSKNIINPLTGGLQATTNYPVRDSGIYAGYTGGRNGANENASGEGNGSTYQNPNNIKEDRAVAFNDIRQMLNFATTYQLPFGMGQRFLNHRGALNYLVGGLEIYAEFQCRKRHPLESKRPL
jgi:hypothetical protein